MRGFGVLLLASIVSGCASPGVTEGDRLREQVMDLETENRRLADRVSELETELAVAAAAPDTIPDDVVAATPRVAGVDIRRRSHLTEDTAVLYVRPRDGRGRFLQVAGTIDAIAAVLPIDGDPVTVGRLRLTPPEVRDAYRSGLIGTHYTIEIPVDLPDDLDTGVSVRVRFTDGVSGRVFDAETVLANP